MVVNHLNTSHYYLALICKRYLLFFTTNSNDMQCHVQGCEPTCPNDDSSDDEELGTRNGGDRNKPCDIITAQQHSIQTFAKEVLTVHYFIKKAFLKLLNGHSCQ